jgi:hypothetical protein
MNDNFLFVGRHWKISGVPTINFDQDWLNPLSKIIINNGRLSDNSAIDFFIHKANMINILPFAIGRDHWDRWFMYETLRQHITTVDITITATTVHKDGTINSSMQRMGTEENDYNRFGIVNCHNTGKNINDSKYYTKYKIIDNHLDIVMVKRF